MSKIIEIGISKNKGGKIENVISIDVIKGKGLNGDRKFKTDNNIKSQLTLIEIENIKHFNNISKTNVPSVDFRRNIITKDIRLNEFVDKEFYVGNVKLKGHDLCRPCKTLQEKLGKDNIIKEFLRKGGLRCQILKSGSISIGDLVKVI